jgi:hypothetical protein
MPKDCTCAPICARDAAGRVEMGETPKLGSDARLLSVEVSVDTGDGPRRQRRPSYCS